MILIVADDKNKIADKLEIPDRIDIKNDTKMGFSKGSVKYLAPPIFHLIFAHLVCLLRNLFIDQYSFIFLIR